jgi:hypothetical protein
MTTLQRVAVVATVSLLAGAGFYEGHQASRLLGRVETLQRQQAPLLQQLAALKTENERLSDQLARIGGAQALSPTELGELLRRRGQATAAQADDREILQLKAKLAEQNGKLPDTLMICLARGMHFEEQREKKQALAPLARMREALHLKDEQALAVSNAMMLRIEREHQLEFDMFAQRATSNDLVRAAGLIDQQENELKALLNPEQQAAYAEYLQKEKGLTASDTARWEAGRLVEEFKLSREQQDQVRVRLQEFYLQASPDPLDLRGMLQAATSSQPAAALQAAVEQKQSRLEDRLKVLGEFLTPEQTQAYREDRLQRLNMEALQVRLLMPQLAAAK